MKNLYITFLVIFSATFATYAMDSEKITSSNVKEVGGHEYVDLGLPGGVFWATTNLGASSPYEAGDRFAWGDVDPGTGEFTWEDYKYFIETSYDPSNNSVIHIVEDLGENISGTKYDAASHLWGNGWRMPTKEECLEITQKCSFEWVMENGVYGRRIHGPNNSSIFLPALLEPHKQIGRYWTATSYNSEILGGPSAVVDNNLESNAYCLLDDQVTFNTVYFSAKFDGLLIRPVISRSDISGIEEVECKQNNISILFKGDSLIIDGPKGEYLFNIYDISGTCLQSGTTQENIIRLTSTGKGTYIVTLNNGHEIIKSQKLII